MPYPHDLIGSSAALHRSEFILNKHRRLLLRWLPEPRSPCQSPVTMERHNRTLMSKLLDVDKSCLTRDTNRRNTCTSSTQATKSHTSQTKKESWIHSGGKKNPLNVHCFPFTLRRLLSSSLSAGQGPALYRLSLISRSCLLWMHLAWGGGKCHP